MSLLQTKRWLSRIFCIALLLVPLAGCGGDKKPEPAKTGKIVVYSPVNDGYLQKIAAEFAKDSGIRVETVKLSAGEMIARVLAEKSSPQAVDSLRQNTRLIVYDFVWAGKNRKVLVDKWNAMVK